MSVKIILCVLPLACSAISVQREDDISAVYGLPVLDKVQSPYKIGYNFQGLDELRNAKSLLNTFPFNQEEIRLTESLSNEPLNSKQTINRGVARTAPKPISNRVKLNVPQYSFLRQQDAPEDAPELTTELPSTATDPINLDENDSEADTVDSTTQSADTTDQGLPTATGAPEDNLEGEEVTEDKDENNYYGSSALNNLVSLQPDKNGKKCVNKVMMVEETVWDDVEICDHSYDRRCHTSYTTSFEAQQQQQCEENYRKNCFINYEKIAFNQTVQICRNPLVKDCTQTGESICRTEYESECETSQEEYEVEDDVVDCQEFQEEKCRDVVFGYTTQTKCQKFPRNECSVKKQTVKKYSPITNCKKVPIELCAPAGCGFKQGAEVCYDKVQTIVQDKPSEECNIEPQRVCKHVTKLVPRLVPKEECVDVPKEICSRARRNPRKVQKPMIKQWCYVPSPESGLA